MLKLKEKTEVVIRIFYLIINNFHITLYIILHHLVKAE